jgi:hypothetical protein
MRSRSSSPSPARIAAWLLVGLSSTLAIGAPGVQAEPPVPHPLAAFEPFVGKTWKGLVDPDKEVYDVARWERAVAGQAVRIVHSVADGAYGGETLVMWDRAREELVYFYFTTAGFYTQGTMSFDDAGRLVSREAVTGHEGGVTEVRATQSIEPDGRLRVRTQMLRDGAWEERDEVTYVVDPEAEVVLPQE